MSDNADDQDMNFAEGEAESAAPAKKVKGAGPGLARLLMFIGIGLGAVIFIITVVVITVGIINRQGKPMAEVPVSEAYQQTTPVFQYVSTIGEVRTRTIDKEPSSVVVKLNLGFETSDKEAPNDVTQRLPQIRDFLRTYFSSKTIEDLDPGKEGLIKEELRENLNRILSKPSLKEVLFEKFDVVKL
jgi:flagellar FliL protein